VQAEKQDLIGLAITRFALSLGRWGRHVVIALACLMARVEFGLPLFLSPRVAVASFRTVVMMQLER
jgi:hypothetical protein